ncbi:MAG: glycosyltransferase, partial [Planctomycetales bacterium]
FRPGCRRCQRCRKRRYAAELKKSVAELGLERDVTFTDQRSDMKEFYAVSDVAFSLSSKPESFGRTVLETMNSGDSGRWVLARRRDSE